MIACFDLVAELGGRMFENDDWRVLPWSVIAEAARAT
jgi:hypothetical protein